MPTLNGVSLTWDENSPADSESAGLGDDRMRSIKSTVRTGLNAEHNWPAAGGSNVGYHVYGSARPFYDVQSNVSSSGTDGRLYVTSDTSKLFGVGSGGTVLLGAGPGALSIGTTPGASFPQRSYWVEEIGAGFSNSLGFLSATFPNSGFSGIPYVFTSIQTTTNAAFAIASNVYNLTASGCSITVWQTDTLSGYSGAYVVWRSLGTRTL